MQPTTLPTDSRKPISKSEIRNSKFRFARTEGNTASTEKKRLFHPLFHPWLEFFCLRTYHVGSDTGLGQTSQSREQQITEIQKQIQQTE